MDINDSAILQEILSLSKESAAADARISTELSGVKDTVSQMKVRMDKQDILLEHLAVQVNEQKRLAEDMAALKDTVNKQEEELRLLKQAPADRALKFQGHVSDELVDGILTFLISAFTSGVVAVVAKLFFTDGK